MLKYISVKNICHVGMFYKTMKYMFFWDMRICNKNILTKLYSD